MLLYGLRNPALDKTFATLISTWNVSSPSAETPSWSPGFFLGGLLPHFMEWPDWKRPQDHRVQP